MYNALLAHIARYVALTPAEGQLVCEHLRLQTVPRKAHLLAAGQPCTANYFVAQGCLRMYFVTEKGTEQITRFALENWWLTDYTSLLSQQPSRFFIQAVEPTTVAVRTPRLVPARPVGPIDSCSRCCLRCSRSGSAGPVPRTSCTGACSSARGRP